MWWKALIEAGVSQTSNVVQNVLERKSDKAIIDSKLEISKEQNASNERIAKLSLPGETETKKESNNTTIIIIVIVVIISIVIIYKTSK